MAEALEKILECPICLEQIENPKMLPCQHSFCMKNCLENIVIRNSVDQRRQQLTCPICRKQFPVPENGISGFPNNYVLQNLLDNQEKYRNPEADTSSIKPSAPPPDQKGIEPKPSAPPLSEDPNSHQSWSENPKPSAFPSSQSRPPSNAGSVQLDELGKILDQFGIAMSSRSGLMSGSRNGVTVNYSINQGRPSPDESDNINCFNCKNCHKCKNCTNCKDCDNCKNCTNCKNCRNCKNCTNCKNCRNCFNCSNCKDCDNCKNCTDCVNSTNCFNCHNCINCDNLVNCSDCSNVSNRKNCHGLHL